MHSLALAITWDSWASTLLLGQVLYVLPVLFILILIAYFISKPWLRRSQEVQARSLRAFQKWGVAVTPEEMPRLRESLWRCWKPILLFSALGATGCSLLVSLVLVVASELHPGALAWMDYVDADLWLAENFFSITAGLLIGYLVGIWWVKRHPQNRLSYGDLAPRRLSNYRSPWFFWAEVLIVAFYAAMTRLALTNLLDPSHLRLLSITGQILMIPIYPGLWILWGPPLLMLCISLATELGASWLVASPRLLVVSDPQLSRRLDDMLRAQTIGALQGMALLMISELGLAQASLLARNTGAGIWELTSNFAFVPLLVCVGIFLLNGRLGGKQMGWPWTVKVAS
jgi:hypothetical protein